MKSLKETHEIYGWFIRVGLNGAVNRGLDEFDHAIVADHEA
jgi:hypothetical protein